MPYITHADLADSPGALELSQVASDEHRPPVRAELLDAAFLPTAAGSHPGRELRVQQVGGQVRNPLVATVADHGNIASATLPLQLRLARERGMVGPGSLVLMIGLAGGISLGLMVVKL